jgi:hypothetical protein
MHFLPLTESLHLYNEIVKLGMLLKLVKKRPNIMIHLLQDVPPTTHLKHPQFVFLHSDQ